MSGGRARAAALGAVFACAAAVAVAGCGASSHPNQPRPAVSTRISVVIQPRGVTVQPGRIGGGQEDSQQIPQNEGQPQPRIKSDEPLDVTIVAANQTGQETHLTISGTKEVNAGPVFARSPATFQASLPTGSYTVASDLKGSRPAHFTVGPYRASSQNDLLTP